MRAAIVDARIQPVVNLATNPQAREHVGGWPPNDGNVTSITFVTDAPDYGTAIRSQHVAGAAGGALLSLYSIDNLGSDARTRFVGCLLWASAAGYSGRIRGCGYVPLPVRQWTWVTGTISGYAVADISTASGSPSTDDYGYATRCLSVADPRNIEPGYFDGDSPGAVWLGTPQASASVGWPRLT